MWAAAVALICLAAPVLEAVHREQTHVLLQKPVLQSLGGDVLLVAPSAAPRWEAACVSIAPVWGYAAASTDAVTAPFGSPIGQGVIEGGRSASPPLLLAASEAPCSDVSSDTTSEHARDVRGRVGQEAKRTLWGKGAATRWLEFDSARREVRRLAHARRSDFWEWWKRERPRNLPYNPDKAYRHAGWTSWSDFLGYDDGMSAMSAWAGSRCDQCAAEPVAYGRVDVTGHAWESFLCNKCGSHALAAARGAPDEGGAKMTPDAAAGTRVPLQTSSVSEDSDSPPASAAATPLNPTPYTRPDPLAPATAAVTTLGPRPYTTRSGEGEPRGCL